MTTEVEWRRRWKPDILAQPWKTMSLNGTETHFLTKSFFTESGYEILFSDKISLWYEELDVENINKRTKKLNPSVEAPLSKILDHLQDNVDNIDTGRHVTASATFKNLADSEERKVLVTLSTKLAGLPFIWKFSAMPTDSKMLSDHLLVPLLTMTGELLRRQQELYKLLHNKDKEIDDLKAQGVKTTRKHLETGAFDEVIFKNNMSSSKGFDQQIESRGNMAFDDDGQTLYQELLTKQAYLYRDPSYDIDGGTGTFDEEGMSVTEGVGSSWTNRLPPSLAGGGTVSPKRSPVKSPTKSPRKAGASGDEDSPVKNMERKRRQELEERLAQEAERKEQKKKKKKFKL